MVERHYVEESFPMAEVGAVSRSEKSARTGNIASFHTWWARRPSSTSRAINFATLIKHPDDIDEQHNLQTLITKLAHWKVGDDLSLLDSARKMIKSANNLKEPVVLDSFGGGGAIPLEFLRLGCKTHTGDINPVAILILKCTLEYPQLYSQIEVSGSMINEQHSNKLVEDLKHWGNVMLEEVKTALSVFYNSNNPNETIVGFIWAKTLPCQNPSCGIEVPLMRQYWLSNKEDKKIALYPFVLNNKIQFKIVERDKREYDEMPSGFDPKNGSVKSAIVTCLSCHATISSDTTRRLFLDKKSGERLVAVVYTDKTRPRQKFYRTSNDDDLDRIVRAEATFATLAKKLRKTWRIEPIPNEPTPDGRGRGAERAFAIRSYGYEQWGDLFNSRQKLTLLTFIEKIRETYDKMKNVYDNEYAKVLTTYMAMTLDRMVVSYNRFSQWQANSEKMGNMFSMHALSMIWDYAEPNAAGDAVRSWSSLFMDTTNTIHGCASTCRFPATVQQGSATKLTYPDNYFDAVVTDPPYYDNVPYSYLSDIFYVWLKRSIGHLYPDLFATPLTPKSNEIVVYSNNVGGFEYGVKFFKSELKKSLREIHRVLKPEGIAVIVYAHKSTEGWEALIDALLESGLVITGSWPLHTERPTRSRGQGAASLASSIYMITRKWNKVDIGFYKKVKREMSAYLETKLEKLWNEGVHGADFLIAGIGSAIEVFARYDRVINEAGSTITSRQLLSDTREMVTSHAINKVLKGNTANQLTPLTRFYILSRWAHADNKIPFDEALKLSQSIGIDITRDRKIGFIVKKGEYIYVLGPSERDDAELDKSDELIDLLHMAMRSWKFKRTSLPANYKMNLQENSHLVRRVAQAISESLPLESEEKKWIDGFLTGFELTSRPAHTQTSLMEVT